MTCQSLRAAAVCGALAASVMSVSGAEGPVTPTVGERPAVEVHLDQADIEDGRVPLVDLLAHGETLFRTAFNRLDGRGRPGTTGSGDPRLPDQPAFIRTSGPDAGSCVACHNMPRAGGAGDFVANVFTLAQARDPVTWSIASDESNERNTPGMMGSGAIEMLAREMTAELTAARESARARALHTGQPVTAPLVAKGVNFGRITVLPDGRVDPAQIEGVDWDLVIKPFHQKGAVVSLREFTNNATNHHHGMQAVERYGAGTDPDLDGVTDELTVGDITALTVWQASLGVPGRQLPAHPLRRRAALGGEQVFVGVGCGACHVPAMRLDQREFSEPGPLNPPGNLTLEDVSRPLTFDLTRDGPRPRLERLPEGGALVRAFTDLKRHDLCDEEIGHFDNEQLAQGMLAGSADPESFTLPVAPRPTRQFLTSRLWDVGSSPPYGHRGDLSTLTEAIEAHGGEAREARERFLALSAADRASVIEFLKTLQVLPEGSPRILLEVAGRERGRAYSQ